jgi:hypothetical protein
MTRHRTFPALVLVLIWCAAVAASGPIGIYGIIERVVFEPDEQTAQRIQVWGAFAYAEPGAPTTISPVVRGYLYFQLPESDPADVARREWSDLKAVAGTTQAVAFGSWFYGGRFGALRPDGASTPGPYMRVRPASERPASPAVYQTNAGVMKLSATGSHAAIVKQLQDALAR